MSEKQPNEPRSFSRFPDWCRHIDSLSEEARYTVKVLLKKARTNDPEAAEQILSSMTELDLGRNRITDISFLHSLTNLTTLDLGYNEITDITSLASLTNLTTLSLRGNQIIDISSLGSLTNLTTLDLGDNKITDFSFLGSLTNLTTLDLSYSQITDISSLGSLTNLTTLNLYRNRITDISFLGSLTNLTTLDLESNKITDFSFLGSLTNLTTLNLDWYQITDISFLGSLTNLTTLNLGYNQITDISFLGSLTNLTTLSLGGSQITDISSLGSLTNLTTLSLGGSQITDISALRSLTNLTTLDLGGNQITDFSFLGSLTNLTELYLNDNQISDISFLGSLTNLTELHLDHNQITDISFLGSLTNLTTLHLDHNQITDISALRALTNLTTLHLDSNPITALCVLGELAQKRLTLSTTPIDAQKATEAVKVAYAAIGLEQPEVIICSSPHDAYLQIFNLPKGDHSPNWSNEGHGNRLGKQLDGKWMSMSPSIVREFTSPAVWGYELDCMAIEPEADSTLSSLMYELADGYVRSERTMGNVFPDYLEGLEYPETPTTLFKEIYLTEWYISSLGVNVSEKAQEILRCQKLLFEHCGWIFPFEKICFVCDRPHLRFDSQNRLHAEGEPAIQFADRWNFYYYHGVRLPKKYGKLHPNQWQSQWLLTEDNAELRRVLIQGIGYERIIQELSATQIDIWQEYALLKIDKASDWEQIYLLKMTCPSTGFIHVLRVPHLTSARKAIRWVNWGIDPEEFSVQT
ncbi:leucine-rich repeat domain-containing protein [Microcoleus sp. D3_18a_C4]